jgi:CHAT domain
MTQKPQPATLRKPLVYRDLTLRLAAYDNTAGTVKIWIEQAPSGAMRVADAAVCAYDPKAFWNNPDLGLGGLVGNLEKRRLDGPGDLYKLGIMLADLALPKGPVRELFQRSLTLVESAGEGLRLRLRIDDVALSQLPWEYLFVQQTSGEPQPGDFLALRQQVSIVRTDTLETAPVLSSKEPVRRIVGVLSSPDDQIALNVDRDKAALEQAVKTVKELAGDTAVTVVWAERPTTRTHIEQALVGKADLFLFAGHGIMQETSADPTSKEGQLVLETEDYRSDFYGSQQLAQLLRDAQVRLAVLGACDTGRRDGQNVWSGLAPALVRQNLPAVIANQFPIRDSNATLITAKIYPFLLTGYTIDEAVYEARKSIFQAKGVVERDWGTPVLYLQQDVDVLFPQASAESDRTTSNPLVRAVVKLGNIEDEATGATFGDVHRGTVDLNVTARDVKKGGKFTGAEFGDIG